MSRTVSGRRVLGRCELWTGAAVRAGLIGMMMGVIALTTGCQRSPGDLMADFGLGQRPEGGASPTDRVYERLQSVGETELSRLNGQSQRGEIKFQQEGPYQGRYYRELKVYESARPYDVRRGSRGGSGPERGYVGYIDYDYQVYQSERRNTRAEVEFEPADIPTGERGRERYRYNFTPGGGWDGRRGELVRR